MTESREPDLSTPAYNGPRVNSRLHGPAGVSQRRDLLRAVIAHTPRLIASRVLDAPHSEALVLSLEGTVMFADLDGFTPLAERFSRLPANVGAEELTNLVNRFMAILIRTSQSYGGDLLKFAGDAGLLFFDGPAHALRAVTAATMVQRMIQDELSSIETSFGQFSLQAAIGIAGGRLIGLGVGDAQGREFLPFGPPLLAVGHAQSIAPPTGIVIHSSTALACGAAVVCDALESDYLQVVALPGAVQGAAAAGSGVQLEVDDQRSLLWYHTRLDALSSYLSPGLLELLTLEISVGSNAVSSDRRLVTVMMISLAKPDDLMEYWGQPDKLGQALQAPSETFVCVRDVIHRYGGVLNKVSFGPSGLYLMALFGAPTAHEDDPLRAVLAALELEEEFSHDLRIGINTGYVFAGDVGTGERREYTVMGDEVNLAARLMSACSGGEIWLGPNTGSHSAVQRQVLVERGVPVHLKGKSQPVQPYLVKSLRQLRTAMFAGTTALVGRQREVSFLWQQLARSSSREPHFILLRGEAGVGKSALLYTLIDRVKREGIAVHMGSAPSYGDHLPFAGWDQVLSSLLGLDGVPREHQQAILVAQLEKHGVAEWAALVAPIVGLSVSASTEVLSLPPAMRDMQRQSVLLTVLASAAKEQPCLLAFDNAQWMSSASIELLDVVVDALPNVPLDVCVVSRERSSVVARWQKSQGVSEVDLGPLSAEAIRHLVASQLDDIPVPGTVADWIVERSGGMPLFAAEAVRTLIGSGLLQYQDDRWVLTGTLEESQLPDMIFGLVQSRIDRLAPADRHLLRAAAVVGHEMTLKTLVAAYGEETEASVRRKLPQLAPFGLQPRDTADQILFFRQPLVREVAYRGLPHRVQCQIHVRLAGYFDANRESVAPNWLTLVAYHAFEGQMWSRAVEANLILGRQAVQTYLADQARQALNRVLEAADSGGLPVPEARYEAHYLLSETMTSLGLYDGALAHLDAARRIFEQLDELESRDVNVQSVASAASLDYLEATVLEAQGHYAEALSIVESSLAVRGVTRSIDGARLCLVAADLQRRMRDYAQARAWAERALTICSQTPAAGTQSVRSRAMYMMALLVSLERLQHGDKISSR